MKKSLIIDLHLHSRFSQAVSKYINLSTLSEWGNKKGIDVLSTSDVTHPLWFGELQEQLQAVNDGVYKLKGVEEDSSPFFILTTELSLIYSEFGKGRRVHMIVCFPNLEIVAKVNSEFIKQGFNLASDGRPILGISLRRLCNLLSKIDHEIVLIPAHAWTPWFGIYGSKSGYDSLAEAFGEYADQIFAIESGLSSDPIMNWQVEELKNRSIVSFSDAHSLSKIGREATVLQLKDKISNDGEISLKDITYTNIINGMKKGSNSPFDVDYTIEYYPEEGKYHYTGHRNCKVKFNPFETAEQGTTYPVCGRELTVGVLHRLEELSGKELITTRDLKDTQGVIWQHHSDYGKFVHMVPLLEILSECYGVNIQTKKVSTAYSTLLQMLGSELDILLTAEILDIKRVGGERVSQAIQKVRMRDLSIDPGYDGEYGKVSIWNEEDTMQPEQLKMI
jgi:uncharacterized protein (TIGR00375 family)